MHTVFGGRRRLGNLEVLNVCNRSTQQRTALHPAGFLTLFTKSPFEIIWTKNLIIWRIWLLIHIFTIEVLDLIKTWQAAVVTTLNEREQIKIVRKDMIWAGLFWDISAWAEQLNGWLLFEYNFQITKINFKKHKTRQDLTFGHTHKVWKLGNISSRGNLNLSPFPSIPNEEWLSFNPVSDSSLLKSS